MAGKVREFLTAVTAHIYTHTHNHFMALRTLSGTTWVSRYQKKHSPTHTYCVHRSSLICFIHLLRSMASSLFNLRAWQFLFTVYVQVFLGLPVGLAPFTLYFIHFFNYCLLFAAHAHTIATCFAVVPRLCHLILVCLSTFYLELYLVASCHTSFYGTRAGRPSVWTWSVYLPTSWLRAPSVTTREDPLRSLLLSPAEGCRKAYNPSVTWPLLVSFSTLNLLCISRGVLIQQQTTLIFNVLCFNTGDTSSQQRSSSHQRCKMLQISRYTFLQTDRGSPELQMLVLLSVSRSTGMDFLL